VQHIYLHYTVLWSINTIGHDANMADYMVQQHDYGVLPPTTELSRTTMSAIKLEPLLLNYPNYVDTFVLGSLVVFP
jgi:hypothetical protein